MEGMEGMEGPSGQQGGQEPADAPVSETPWSHRSRFLREWRRPEVVRQRPNAPWLAVASVCVGAFMGQLDASIVTVAFPALERSFGASLASVTWVGLSYLLVLIAAVTVAGRFADVAGRKLLYVYGFLVFIIGSGLCALAPSLPSLIAFRVLQAFGAALLQANSVAIIALAVPSTALGRAIGYQGAAQAMGLALGPTVGGLLLAVGGWQLIFLVNVPFGLLGMVAGILFIPRSRHLGAWRGWLQFDWWGVVLLFSGTVGALYAVSFSATSGWTSPVILGSLLGGVALLVTFGLFELHRRGHDPLLDVALFARRALSMGVGGAMLAFLVLFGVLLVVPFYLERGFGLGSGLAGLELMTMPLALGVVAPVAGRLADRIGARAPTAAGMLLASVALLAAGLAQPGPALLAPALAGTGAGLGMFIAPNNAAVMGAAPPERSGAVSGVINMARGIGTALGLALTGLVFTAGGGASHAPDQVVQAFSHAFVMLGAVAAAAAVLGALRGGGSLAAGRVPAADAL